MSDTITYAYAGDITKTYDDDGDLVVIGKATGPDLDLDGQICDPTWLKSAMPAWMSFGGNVREMHQPIAAGVGLELSEDGDDWHLKSKCVDPVTRTKIEKEVLRGYSIGIQGAKVVKDKAAPGGRIVGGTICEISYVDRPCNPTAVMAIAKGAGLTQAVEAADAERTYVYADELAKADNPDNALAAEWRPEDSYNPDNSDDAINPDPHNPCPNCNGLGKLPETGQTCPTCNGTGTTEELVDSTVASNPNAMIPDEEKGAEPELEKRDYTDAERADMEESGQAMSGGGFPIRTVADLRNAISSIGRAKDPAAARAHIKQRAEALGRGDMIPDAWKGADADLVKVEHDPAALAAVRGSLIELIKAELDEMVKGEEDETLDISHLLAALQIFLEWWEHESDEGETTGPFDNNETEMEEGADMDLVTLGVSADIVKAAKTGGDDERAALRADIVKALGIDTMVEELNLAKAAMAEQVENLSSELERVKTMAAPGGPAITRTQAQAHKSAEAERLKIEAQRYKAIAEQVTDPDLKHGYIAKAVEMERNAASLLNG